MPEIMRPVPLLVLHVAFGNPLQALGNHKIFRFAVRQFLVHFFYHIGNRRAFTDQITGFEETLKLCNVLQNIRSFENSQLLFQTVCRINESLQKIGLFIKQGLLKPPIKRIDHRGKHGIFRIAACRNAPDLLCNFTRLTLADTEPGAQLVQAGYHALFHSTLSFRNHFGADLTLKDKVRHIRPPEMLVQGDIGLADRMTPDKPFCVIIIDLDLPYSPDSEQHKSRKQDQNEF